MEVSGLEKCSVPQCRWDQYSVKCYLQKVEIQWAQCSAVPVVGIQSSQMSFLHPRIAPPLPAPSPICAFITKPASCPQSSRWHPQRPVTWKEGHWTENWKEGHWKHVLLPQVIWDDHCNHEISWADGWKESSISECDIWYEWISEYIRIKKMTRTNIWIYSYEHFWYERISEYIRIKILIRTNIRLNIRIKNIRIFEYIRQDWHQYCAFTI